MAVLGLTKTETDLNFSAFDDGSIQSLKNEISVAAVCERDESKTLHATITNHDTCAWYHSATCYLKLVKSTTYHLSQQCTTFPMF